MTWHIQRLLSRVPCRNYAGVFNECASTLRSMRRLRLHDPPGYLLALAAVALLAGFGLMGYEGARFGEHADPWHHFWFDLGVGFIGLALVLVIASVVLFVREMRRPPGGEQELTGPTRIVPTPAPRLAEEVEVKRWFRVELKRRFR